GRRQLAERIAVVLGALGWWRPRSSAGSRRGAWAGGRGGGPACPGPAGAQWEAEARSVLGSRANRAVLVTISAAAWIADVCCCYCALAAFGINVPFDVVLLAYTIGVLATLVPFVPAGFGLVETAMPLVLQGFGVPLGTAVAAVLVYRCVSTLLPAAIGLACIPGLGVPRRQAPRRPASLLVAKPAAS